MGSAELWRETGGEEKVERQNPGSATVHSVTWGGTYLTVVGLYFLLCQMRLGIPTCLGCCKF